MKTALFLIATVGSAFAVPAFAQDTAGAVPSVQVRYHDLNLATTEGTAALDRRIKAAAERVCGAYDVRDLGVLARINACRRSAVTGTATQVAEAVSAAKRGQAYAQASTGISVSH